MKWILSFTLFFGSFLNSLAAQTNVTPQRALQKLMEGNFRYANDEMLHPRSDTVRREVITSKQEPFAIILACSDSRVSPEIIFDQGIGDLFVVRVAGNIAGPIEMDSIDYGVLHLHAPLILVLGHENCGAVHAVLNHQTQGIEEIAKYIEPALQNIPQTFGSSLDDAIKENVRAVVKQLRENPALKPLMKQKKLMVVGGYYQLGSGMISLIRD